MKNSIVAGLIAGIISSVVVIILDFSGLWELLSVLRYAPTPVSKQTVLLVDTTWWIAWGIIWGAFYALLYDYVPGEGVKKGLIYGLVIWTIVFSRNAVVLASYGLRLWAFLWALTGFFSIGITYGLVLGYLYKK